MTRFEYKRKMAWAVLWVKVWGVLQFFGIYPSLERKWFAWIVSQTGFCYMEPYSPEIHAEWRLDGEL